MSQAELIIGLTGYPASGKDTVADYLVDRGFAKIVLSDLLREEMRALGIPLDRTSMQDFATRMRADRGNAYLAEKSIAMHTGNTLIVGIRNTEELKLYRKEFGNRFMMIAVQTSLETRYARAKQRGRVDDSVSFEQFAAQSEKEKAATSGSHELDAVIEAADVILDNNGTLEQLYASIDGVLQSVIARVQ